SSRISTTAAISTTTTTVMVLVLTSLRLGQTTFFSSLFVSLKYLAIRPKNPLARSRREGFFLPVSLLAFFCSEALAAVSAAAFLSAIVQSSFLLGFAMNRVLLAETAVLLHLETIGIVLLVLFLVVVALLALSTSE